MSESPRTPESVSPYRMSPAGRRPATPRRTSRRVHDEMKLSTPVRALELGFSDDDDDRTPVRRDSRRAVPPPPQLVRASRPPRRRAQPAVNENVRSFAKDMLKNAFQTYYVEQRLAERHVSVRAAAEAAYNIARQQFVHEDAASVHHQQGVVTRNTLQAMELYGREAVDEWVDAFENMAESYMNEVFLRDHILHIHEHLVVTFMRFMEFGGDEYPNASEEDLQQAYVDFAERGYRPPAGHVRVLMPLFVVRYMQQRLTPNRTVFEQIVYEYEEYGEIQGTPYPEFMLDEDHAFGGRHVAPAA